MCLSTGDNTMDQVRKFVNRITPKTPNGVTHPMGEFRTSLNASDLAKRYPMLIKVFKGGMPGQAVQGTWMHEDVALEFARWLSPQFAIG